MMTDEPVFYSRLSFRSTLSSEMAEWPVSLAKEDGKQKKICKIVNRTQRTPLCAVWSSIIAPPRYIGGLSKQTATSLIVKFFLDFLLHSNHDVIAILIVYELRFGNFRSMWSVEKLPSFVITMWLGGKFFSGFIEANKSLNRSSLFLSRLIV